MKDIAMVVLPLAAIAVNFYVLIQCLPRKRSFAFTVSVLAALFVVFFVLELTVLRALLPEWRLGIDLRLLLWLLPIVLLFKGLFFQKVFMYFVPVTVVLDMTFLGRLFAAPFMAYGDSWYWFAISAISIALFALYVMLTWKFGRYIIERLFAFGTEKEWALYAFAAAGCYYILVAIGPLLAENMAVNLFFFFFILWSLFILCFALLNAHDKYKQKYEADFAHNIISTGRGHYQKVAEQYNALQIIKHDYKYHLSAVRNLLRRGETEKIDEYLGDLQMRLLATDMPYYCANTVINSLVADYAERCLKSDIAFDVSVSLPEDFSFPNYEMCIVLGNLLENAVEACQKLTSERKIQLYMKPQGGQLAIMVRNTFDDAGLLMNDGEFVSAKKNGGFGLRSVQAVVERFGEEFIVKHEEGDFIAFVLWKNAQGGTLSSSGADR